MDGSPSWLDHDRAKELRLEVHESNLGQGAKRHLLSCIEFATRSDLIASKDVRAMKADCELVLRLAYAVIETERARRLMSGEDALRARLREIANKWDLDCWSAP